jgi:hypothetical protein
MDGFREQLIAVVYQAVDVYLAYPNWPEAATPSLIA